MNEALKKFLISCLITTIIWLVFVFATLTTGYPIHQKYFWFNPTEIAFFIGLWWVLIILVPVLVLDKDYNSS